MASATLRGVEALPVTVEIVVAPGLPGVSIVGMTDTAIQEARERVRAAICAAGFSMPNKKVIINLAPGYVRKCGSGFDLPMAVAILAATGQIDVDLVKNRLFVGELSLAGTVRPIAGTLAFGICALNQGMELVSAPDSPYVPAARLRQLSLTTLEDLHSSQALKPHINKTVVKPLDSRILSVPDFKDVAGHNLAKRAIQIAAGGKHGLLMMGPPGSGKTMLATRIGSILPPLEESEMLEAAVVHSVAGESVDSLLERIRPFRHPHHSATCAGLVGGGNPVRPGEISLAHEGVLFLDELAEFKASVLQSLRQPMESGTVSITRADGNVSFPAHFMLVAATNPCPCGYYGDDEHNCTCTSTQIQRYQSKIGGPLMDRIDLQIDVKRLPPEHVLASGNGTDSETLRKGVMAAREFAAWRHIHGGENTQASLRLDESLTNQPAREISSQVKKRMGLGEAGAAFAIDMAKAHSMSARGLMSMIRVARTIADLELCEEVKDEHVAEALGFRLREGIGR